MSEKHFHRHEETVSRERAAALAQAGHELGKVAINVIANEGEEFVARGSYNHYADDHIKRGITPSKQPRVVSEGQMRVEIAGMFDNQTGTGPLMDRAAEVQQQFQEQQVVDQEPKQTAV